MHGTWYGMDAQQNFLYNFFGNNAIWVWGQQFFWGRNGIQSSFKTKNVIYFLKEN